MGCDFSKTQEAHLRELEQVTQKASKTQKASGFTIYQVTRRELKELLQYVKIRCPAYPEAGSLSISKWTKLGTYLYQPPRAPPRILTTWKAVMAALQLFAPEEQAGKCTSSSTSLLPPPYVPPTPPSAPSANPVSSVSTSSPEPVSGSLNDAVRQAIAAGDASLSDALACPIEAYPDPANPAQHLYRHISTPYSVVKDIKKAATEYGICNPYTQGLLAAVAGGYRLTSTDWQQLATMILTPSQKTTWDSEFKHAAKRAQRRTFPAGVTMDLVLGEGAANTPQAEAQANADTTRIIKECALAAFAKLENVGQVTKSFTNIRQGPNQAYSDFIDDLTSALNKQIFDKDGREETLLRLAYEQANGDCKAVLAPYQDNPHYKLADYLRACRSVGTHKYVAQIAAEANATALAAALQPRLAQGKRLCFNCGKPGHFRNQCRQPPRASSSQPLSSQELTARPRTVCPKCRKGYHWANQCHSAPAVSQNFSDPQGN